MSRLSLSGVQTIQNCAFIRFCPLILNYSCDFDTTRLSEQKRDHMKTGQTSSICVGRTNSRRLLVQLCITQPRVAARDDSWKDVVTKKTRGRTVKLSEICSSWWLLRAFGSTLSHHSNEFGSKVNATAECFVFDSMGIKFLRFPDGAHSQLPSIDANAPRIKFITARHVLYFIYSLTSSCNEYIKLLDYKKYIPLTKCTQKCAPLRQSEALGMSDSSWIWMIISLFALCHYFSEYYECRRRWGDERGRDGWSHHQWKSTCLRIFAASSCGET